MHVQLFKAGFGSHAALLQVGQLGLDLAQVGVNLLAARTGLLGQLGQAQGFHLQLVGAALGLGGFAAGGHQALRGIGISRFGADQRGARFVGNQRLGAQFLFQVLNLLRTRQQARLFGVLRVKAHAVAADGVARGHVDHFARLQAGAAVQGLVQRLGNAAALQPVGQHRAQAGVVDAQQVCQPGVRARGLRHTGSRGAVESQTRRRRIVFVRAQEAAHHVQAPHFQRAQAFAQGGFQGVFPAGFDVDAAPQALHAIQAVLGQPGAQLAVGLDLFLQRLQGFHAGRQVGLAGAFGVHVLLAGAAVFVQLGHGVLQLGQAGFGGFGLLLGGFELAAQVVQAGFVGRGQGVAVSAQALVAGVELAALLVQAALLGGQHANLLLHLHHAGALLAGAGLRLAQSVFQVGQLHGLLFELGGQQLGALFGIHARTGQVFQLDVGLFLAGLPLGDLLGQGGQALLHAHAAFHHVADFGFEPPHFGRGLVQLALGLVDLVARRVVRLADGFQVRFDSAQVGHARFQVVHGLQAFQAHLGLLGLGVGALQEPQLVLLERGVGVQRVVFGGHLGLLFELFEVGVQLAQDVFHPREVFARVGQAVFRLAAALFVFGNPGRFFEEQAQLFGARFDDAADGALPDDGVGAGPQARAQKHVLHVAAAHGLVVQKVAAGAVAREHAAHGHLAVLAPLAACAVVGVVKHQLHAGAAGLLAGGGAAENHVLHALAAQLAGLALAQHPAHRIHDVGFAATVRPHHAHQLPWQHEVGGFSERLEAGELDGGKTHGSGGGSVEQGQQRTTTQIAQEAAGDLGRPG